jgi:hypothetical protein
MTTYNARVALTLEVGCGREQESHWTSPLLATLAADELQQSCVNNIRRK